MKDNRLSGHPFEPRVWGYVCGRCCRPPDEHLAPPSPEFNHHFHHVHFMCATEVKPEVIREAFVDGADGVLVVCCLAGSCLGQASNLDMVRTIYRSLIHMKDLGVASDRLHQEWMSPTEHHKVEAMIHAFKDRLRELGPARRPEADVFEREAEA